MNLRELFINWLTASRFIQSLEARHHEQRQDFTERLADKDTQIKQLRANLIAARFECDRLRAAAYGAPMPIQQIAPPVIPEFTGPDDWQAELQRMYEQEESNGTHSNGREEIYESAADDGAQPES